LDLHSFTNLKANSRILDSIQELTQRWAGFFRLFPGRVVAGAWNQAQLTIRKVVTELFGFVHAG
jgi:hypothetical protein